MGTRVTARFGRKIVRFKSSSKSILFGIAASLLCASCGANFQERAFKAYINHPTRTLTDTVRLLEGKSNLERRLAAERILRAKDIAYQVHTYAGDDGSNLIFDLGRGRRALVVSAHLDAVPKSPGANDDASCVASVIQAYETLRREPLPNLMVRFILSDGEESGLVGSKAYLADHPAEGVFGMFSLELCGIGDTVAVWESKETERETLAVRTLLRTLKAMKADHVVEGDIPRFGSDHVRFQQAGVPALALTMIPNADKEILRDFVFNPRSPRWRNRKNWPSIFHRYHTPRDTADSLQENAMRLMSEVVRRTVQKLNREMKPPDADAPARAS